MPLAVKFIYWVHIILTVILTGTILVKHQAAITFVYTIFGISQFTIGLLRELCHSSYRLLDNHRVEYSHIFGNESVFCHGL